MNKFYFEGKEVSLVDTITASHKSDDGKVVTTLTTSITDFTLPLLVQAGIITVKKVDDNSKDVDYFINKIATKMGWNVNKAYNILEEVYNLYPAAVFSIILREVAVELDHKYEDHIQNSPEIFVVSTLDGRISKANKAHIKNYRNFAAFRSIEDAKTACKILREILKSMYAKKQ
jgi:uncharacterized protein (DUF2267 family)